MGLNQFVGRSLEVGFGYTCRFALRYNCFSQETTQAGQRRKPYILITATYRCGAAPLHRRFLDRRSMLRHPHAGLKAWEGRCLYRLFSPFTIFSSVGETSTFITGTFVHRFGISSSHFCYLLSPVSANWSTLFRNENCAYL